MKVCNLDKILSCPKQRSSCSFAICFRALQILEIACFILASIVLFETIVVIAAFLASSAVIIEGHSINLKTL